MTLHGRAGGPPPIGRPSVGRSSAASRGRKVADPLVCFCNEVPQSAVQAAMAAGATSLAELFDRTFAGCGPCGGSCQPELAKMLAEHLAAVRKAQETR